MNRTKVIIFDIDGVIVNSSAMYTNVIENVLKKGGFNLDRAFVAEKIIAHIEKWVDALLPQDMSGRNRILSEIVEEVKEETSKASGEVVFQEGIEKVIDFLSKSSALFLITNSGSKLTEKVLSKRHLKRFFKEIITSDDGFDSKENAIEHIVKKYMLKKNEVVYVGDTKKDVICAKSVGCKSVILYTPFSWNYGKYEDIKAAGPDAMAN